MLSKREYRKETIKETIATILILLGGVAFTVTSFCVYYLVKPQNTIALIAICVVDFLYTLFSAIMLLKSMFIEKWLSKGLLLAFGYIAAFIIIPTFYLLFQGAIDLLKNIILAIVYFAFFTGPCIIIILTIIALIMIMYDGGG